MNGIMETLQGLAKALEGGGYNAAPGSLVQGSALQIEDLSPVMHNVTFGQEHLKLQKVLKVVPCKSTLAQFDRQLSYGIFGGSAQVEGAVGQEETSDFVRAVVPMCYYSHVRKVTIVANLVATVDGVKAEDRAAADAALKLAGDIEFDIFRGRADYSNAGAFDGNFLAIPTATPNMFGLDVQIRSSDNMTNTQDLMFAEYGSNLSVVINCGTVLTNDQVENAAVRSAMNMGNANRLLIDPLTLSAYNRTSIGSKERIVLAGSPQEAGGADLRRQWVSGGTVELEASRFLSGKTGPARARSSSPAAPTFTTAAASSSTTLNGTYTYIVTGVNELGESAPSASGSQALTSTQKCTLTITPGTGTNRYFNVYRSPAGGAASTCRFIGRVANSGGATTDFVDLGNKVQGFVTGFMLQTDTAEIKEMAPYSRLKLAVGDLGQPEAHFRFATLAVMQPRKNVLLDNVLGNL
jgi:hypothetical protein